jgi:hypothetical protein
LKPAPDGRLSFPEAEAVFLWLAGIALGILAATLLG